MTNKELLELFESDVVEIIRWESDLVGNQFVNNSLNNLLRMMDLLIFKL